MVLGATLKPCAISRTEQPGVSLVLVTPKR
jgi:hypothetical protein